ncbi:MAG TPA: LPO_1073/Vpar_1526 family protein [Gammaproteobacteria bacterium]|nr:LPO_1073/Vpar_1526 family protein [Gammaproteobacteria bacterium]
MKQETGDGSGAYQAGRDIVIDNRSGLGYSDVKALCLDLIHANFPKLQEEAMSQVNQRIIEFSEQLKSQIDEKGTAADSSRLARPDVQAALNDALQGAAKKGTTNDYPTLARLVAARLDRGNNELLDIVIEEAIRVTPKLTQEHIKYLTIHHFIGAVKTKVPNVSLEMLESMTKPIHERFCSGCKLSYANVNYLAGVGVISLKSIRSGDSYENYLKVYPWLASNMDDFKEKLKREAPCIHDLLEVCNDEKYVSTRLTSTGQAIALTNISMFFPGIDLKIWIS